MAKRRSFTDEAFLEAVANNKSWAGVLRDLSLFVGGSNYDTVQRLAGKLEVSTEHFTGQGWNVGLRFVPKPKQPLSEILVCDSKYVNTNKLKKRLYNEGIKSPQCELCGVASWLGAELVMHLDHINGDRRDNRVENLRILCPNCHSQTSTYCGRNIGKAGVPQR